MDDSVAVRAKAHKVVQSGDLSGPDLRQWGSVVYFNARIAGVRSVFFERIQSAAFAPKPSVILLKESLLRCGKPRRPFALQVRHELRPSLRPCTVFGARRHLIEWAWTTLCDDSVSGSPDHGEARSPVSRREVMRENLEAESFRRSQAEYSLGRQSDSAIRDDVIVGGFGEGMLDRIGKQALHHPPNEISSHSAEFRNGNPRKLSQIILNFAPTCDSDDLHLRGAFSKRKSKFLGGIAATSPVFWVPAHCGHSGRQPRE